jgi:hypothetical protein
VVVELRNDPAMNPTRTGVDEAPVALCTIDHALGRTIECPGPACALWDETSNACVFHGAEHELANRPELAEHLVELRRALEAASSDRSGSQLARLLDEEQKAERGRLSGS